MVVGWVGEGERKREREIMYDVKFVLWLGWVCDCIFF